MARKSDYHPPPAPLHWGHWDSTARFEFIKSCLVLHDAKIDRVISYTRPANLFEYKDSAPHETGIVGPVFVVKRKNTHFPYAVMLMNRKVYFEKKQLPSVWMGFVPTGQTGRIELKDNFLIFTCAKTGQVFSLRFNETEDLALINNSLKTWRSYSATATPSTPLAPLTSSEGSQSSSLQSIPLKDAEKDTNEPLEMTWDWLDEGNGPTWKIPMLLNKEKRS